MSAIPPKAWNRLIYSKAEIVAELPASVPGRRRWVAIYPFEFAMDMVTPKHKYSILDFELELAKMPLYEGDEDLIMQNKRRYYAQDEEHLLRLLQEHKIDESLFDTPWKYNYPL